MQFMMSQRDVKVKHMHTMLVINFQLDSFGVSVHKLSNKIKFSVSYSESDAVISDSQALFTNLRKVGKQGQGLCCRCIFLLVLQRNWFKNQPGVNVSRGGLIL